MSRNEDGLLQQAFERGIEIARDPCNARITDPHESRITTIYSPWLLQVCSICRHTIREGDRVRPDPHRPGRMLHEDPQYGLFCWSRATGAPLVAPPTVTACPPDVREAFLRGLHQHWKPAGDATTTLVVPGSPFIGLKCPVCRHTVREGDLVVACSGGDWRRLSGGQRYVLSTTPCMRRQARRRATCSPGCLAGQSWG